MAAACTGAGVVKRLFKSTAAGCAAMLATGVAVVLFGLGAGG